VLNFVWFITGVMFASSLIRGDQSAANPAGNDWGSVRQPWSWYGLAMCVAFLLDQYLHIFGYSYSD